MAADDKPAQESALSESMKELADIGIQVREISTTDTEKKSSLPLKNVFIAICVGLVTVRAASAVWLHQDFLCASAMGDLSTRHGGSIAPF